MLEPTHNLFPHNRKTCCRMSHGLLISRHLFAAQQAPASNTCSMEHCRQCCQLWTRLCWLALEHGVVHVAPQLNSAAGTFLDRGSRLQDFRTPLKAIGSAGELVRSIPFLHDDQFCCCQSDESVCIRPRPQIKWCQNDRRHQRAGGVPDMLVGFSQRPHYRS